MEARDERYGARSAGPEVSLPAVEPLFKLEFNRQEFGQVA